MTTPADIERWLSLLPPSKQGDVKVRHHKDVGPLYHISTNHELGAMMPSVTRRTLSAEDRAIPRISVAPTLAGCILAYQACDYDFDADEYKGWYVYGLPFEHAVRPTKQLLPDVEMSDEHWLVTFDPDTVAYYPRTVANHRYSTPTSVTCSDCFLQGICGSDVPRRVGRSKRESSPPRQIRIQLGQSPI